MPMACGHPLRQGLEDLFRPLFGHFANHGTLSGRSPPLPNSEMAARTQYAASRLHAKDNLKKAQLTINPTPRALSEGRVRSTFTER